MILYNYVIFHKNCFDGFSCLTTFLKSKQFEKDLIIKADVPFTRIIPSDIERKKVIIMDVSYNNEVLEEIINRAKYVTFIDHHATSKRYIERMTKKYKNKFFAVHDEKESGTSLTWKFFNENKRMPNLIKFIKDNDIGEWKYEETMPLIYALQVRLGTVANMKNIQMWMKLYDDREVEKYVKIGMKYEEYAEMLADENMRRHTIELFPSKKLYKNNKNIFNSPEQYKVCVICGFGCPSSSILGRNILKNKNIDCDFVITWLYNMSKKEYVLQFRSKKVDVSKIAEIFGGGGHVLASACNIKREEYSIEELFAD